MRALLFFLAAAVVAAFAAAPQMHAPRLAEARAVCRTVAEGRSDFLIVERYYLGDEEHGWTSLDIDNDGRPEDIAILTSGSSHTPTIELRESNVSLSSDYADAGEDFGAWSGALEFIRHRGRIYEVFYSDSATRDYPVYVAIHLPGGEGKWLCAFESQGRVPRLTPVAGRADAAPICAAVEQQRASGGAGLAFEPIEQQQVGFDAFARGARRIDVMNDGHPRLVREVAYESGAGAGCTTAYYDLAEPQGSEAAEIAALQTMGEPGDRYPVRLANDYAACRGNAPRFHELDGSIVFEQRFPGARPQRHDQELWWVSRIENGRAARLCEAGPFRAAPRTIRYNSALYPAAR